MTPLREAAQQALEALLTYEQYIQPLTNVFGGPRVPEEGSASAKVDAAITTLRAALAEMKPCNKSCAPGYCYCECPHGVTDGNCKECFAALVAAAERERIIAENAPVIEKINAHIKALEDELAAIRARSNT